MFVLPRGQNLLEDVIEEVDISNLVPLHEHYFELLLRYFEGIPNFKIFLLVVISSEEVLQEEQIEFWGFSSRHLHVLFVVWLDQLLVHFPEIDQLIQIEAKFQLHSGHKVLQSLLSISCQLGGCLPIIEEFFVLVEFLYFDSLVFGFQLFENCLNLFELLEWDKERHVHDRVKFVDSEFPVLEEVEHLEHKDRLFRDRALDNDVKGLDHATESD